MLARYYGKLALGYALVAVFLLLAEGSIDWILQFPGGMVARFIDIHDDRILVGISASFLVIALLIPCFAKGRILLLLGWIVFSVLLASIFTAYLGALGQGA